MRYEFLKFEEMQYIVRYPEGYRKGERHPVVFFLHGAGTRGTDISVLHNNPFFHITDAYTDLDMITVAPLCHTNTWFDLFETLERFAAFVATADFTDPERLYLMGVSMGGYGAWQLAMSLPQLFAALVPLCGGGMYWNAGRLINIPIWAFHGALDTTVRPEESEKMVNAVNQKGGNAKLTIYPENSHNCWTDTFENHAVFDWLLSHKKQEAGALSEKYKGSEQFG